MKTRYYFVRTRKLFCLPIKKKLNITRTLRSRRLSQHKNHDFGTRLSHFCGLFLDFLATTQCPTFILKKNVRDEMCEYKTVLTFDEALIILENRPRDVTEADINVIENFAMKVYTKLSKISWQIYQLICLNL